MGNASASLSLDGTLSNILAMKLNAASFFPVITSSLASQSRQQKSGILLQEGPQIYKKTSSLLNKQLIPPMEKGFVLSWWGKNGISLLFVESPKFFS